MSQRREVINLKKISELLVKIPEDIIKGCQDGNDRSQERLYNLVAPVMYGLCLQYSGNEDDARDIMQEGFIKVFNKIGQYTGKGSVMGWIRRIMINTALEKFRSQMNFYTLDEAIIKESDTVDNVIIESLTADDILKVIQTLSPQYRLVFNLYAIEGYSHKEISELTGISEGTSKSNLSRARSILQKRMKDMYSNRMKT